MDLHDRIKIARKAAGLTQQAVADHFRIARVSVTQWEGKVTRPDQDKITDLAHLFRVPTDWLLKGEGPGPAEGEQEPIQLTGEQPTLIKRPAPRRIYIREWREKMGVKASVAATSIGQDPDYYEFLEMRPHKLTIEQIERLALLFGVNFDQLWFPPPPARAEPQAAAKGKRKAANAK